MSKQPYTEVVEPEHVEPADDLHEPMDEDAVPEHAPARKWYFGDGMGKRILSVLVVFLVLGLLWYAYQRHVAAQGDDGSVQVEDTSPKVLAESTDAPVMKKTSVPAATPVPAPATTTTSSMATPAVIPASDSIAPNPANGMAFAGSGKFQVYRQGNLTWRVDTETGHTCIVFATMEEWKKPIVYEHGCANS